MHWNEESMNWIDSFVSQSRGNVNVTEVYLHPYEFGDQDDEFWDKVGQALGNLQSLETIHIYNTYCDEETPLPDCEMLVRILSHVRQRITLIVTPVYYGNGDGADDSPWSVEESRSLAQAFHGHLTITRFEGGEDFPYESLDALYLALSSLPALESIRLGTPEVRLYGASLSTAFLSHPLFIKQQRTHLWKAQRSPRSCSPNAHFLGKKVLL
jgi:hypothetical protein